MSVIKNQWKVIFSIDFCLLSTNILLLGQKWDKDILFHFSDIYSGNLWIGIVQSDLNQKGKHRDYKWARSNETIPNISAYWSNRWIPATDPEACGFIVPSGANSKFHDDKCIKLNKVICEW